MQSKSSIHKLYDPPFCFGRHFGLEFFFYSVLCSTCQALSFDTHIEEIKKKVIRHFVVAAILDLEFFQGVLYSTSQALSFDTHIEGVQKNK